MNGYRLLCALLGLILLLLAIDVDSETAFLELL